MKIEEESGENREKMKWESEERIERVEGNIKVESNDENGDKWRDKVVKESRERN